jgi:hypothetical protein
MSPSGKILNRYGVGGAPKSVAAGPGGRVWVSVTEADKLVWFDAAAAAPTPHDVSTVAPGGCGPVAIVAGPGDGRMYFSLPDAEDPGDPCAGPSRVGYVADTGAGGITTMTGRGTVFDLAVYGGKLYAAAEYEDAILRIRPSDLFVESTV